LLCDARQPAKRSRHPRSKPAPTIIYTSPILTKCLKSAGDDTTDRAFKLFRAGKLGGDRTQNIYPDLNKVVQLPTIGSQDEGLVQFNEP
jgi:hypothetical protein